MADAVPDSSRSDQRARDRQIDPGDGAAARPPLRRAYRRAPCPPRSARPRPLYRRGDGRLHDRGDHGRDRARGRRAGGPLARDVRRLRGGERHPCRRRAGGRSRGLDVLDIDRGARGRGGRHARPDLRHRRGGPPGQGCGAALSDHPGGGAPGHRTPDPGRAAGAGGKPRRVDRHRLGGEPRGGARDRRRDSPAGEGRPGDHPFRQGGPGLADRRRRPAAPPRLARHRGGRSRASNRRRASSAPPSSIRPPRPVPTS